MAITKITDHVERGLARVLSQYDNRPRIRGWIKAYLLECQEVENMLWDIFTLRLVKTPPTGDLLNKLGELVGQARNGQDDTTYLRFILARIKTNRSTGKHETLIEIALILFDTDVAELREFYPPSLSLTVYEVPIDPYLVWKDFLLRAKAAHVPFALRFSMEDFDNTLIFDDINTPLGLLETQCMGDYESDPVGGGVMGGIF